MKYRHIIRPVPAKGVYDNALVVDGHLSYVEPDEGDVPVDAIYVCRLDGQKTTVERDVTKGSLTSKHTFAGWPLPESAK